MLLGCLHVTQSPSIPANTTFCVSILEIPVDRHCTAAPVPRPQQSQHREWIERIEAALKECPANSPPLQCKGPRPVGVLCHLPGACRAQPPGTQRQATAGGASNDRLRSGVLSEEGLDQVRPLSVPVRIWPGKRERRRSWFLTCGILTSVYLFSLMALSGLWIFSCNADSKGNRGLQIWLQQSNPDIIDAGTFLSIV